MAKKIGLLVLIIILLLLSMVVVLDIFEREVPVAESGRIVITQDDLEQNNGVIALKGDFLAVDGIVSPNDFNNSNTTIKHMTLDEIRLYDYPQGTLTAKLTVNTQDVPITGILIDEIHTSYKIFINRRGRQQRRDDRHGSKKYDQGEKERLFTP